MGSQTKLQVIDWLLAHRGYLTFLEFSLLIYHVAVLTVYVSASPLKITVTLSVLEYNG